MNEDKFNYDTKNPIKNSETSESYKNKTPTNRTLFAILVVVIIIVVNALVDNFFNDINDGILYQKIAEEISEVNKTLPMIINDTSLDEIVYDGSREIQYSYTVLNVLKSDIDQNTIPQIMQETKTALTDTIKSSNELNDFKSYNFTFKYNYYDSNGEMFYSILITPDDYNN